MYNFKDLVDVFNELANYEINYRDRFYPGRAFKNVANLVKSSVSYVIEGGIVYLDNGKLGESSSAIFIEYINSGYCSRLIEYKKEFDKTQKVNEDLFSQLQRISGIGPVKAELLAKKFNNLSFSEFINNLPQVGECFAGTSIKFTEMMMTGVSIIKLTNGNRLPWDSANRLANSIIYSVKGKTSTDFYVYKLGSLRRHKSTVGDIDLVVCNFDQDHLDELRNLFYKELDSILVNGPTKIAGVKNGFQVDIRFIEDKYIGCMVLHGTGSSEFNIKMRAHAKALGVRLNEYCIIKDGKEIYFNDEMEVFQFLGLKYVPPKYR